MLDKDINNHPPSMWENSSKFLKFGCVGIIGTAINFSVYYVATEIAGFNINLGAISAFCVAVSSNYILNHQWTFDAQREDNPINLRQFSYYIAGNLIGLFVNLLVLNILTNIAGTTNHLMWQAIGIASGMTFNFLFAKKLVFPTKQ